MTRSDCSPHSGEERKAIAMSSLLRERRESSRVLLGLHHRKEFKKELSADVLDGSMPTWHNLKSRERREPQF